jgi:hypothetical protein
MSEFENSEKEILCQQVVTQVEEAEVVLVVAEVARLVAAAFPLVVVARLVAEVAPLAAAAVPPQAVPDIRLRDLLLIRNCRNSLIQKDSR